MNEYTKINTIWKRDERGRIIVGDYATPEFALLAGCDWTWTEKVDGTNIRVGWDGERIEFGGRTANAQIPAKLVDALRGLFPEPDVFREVFGSDRAVIYGEGYGAGIQKGGGNYSPTQKFVLFDVLVGDWWLRRGDALEVADRFGLRVVPVFGTGSLTWASEQARLGISSSWGDFQAEGLVGKTEPDLFSRKGERIVAKIKSRDFAS